MANVESVIRGLEILRLLNMRTGQSLTELAEGSGLPRGTAYRMLFTLENSGLVERIQNRYWITQKVRTLSHGFDDDWACEVARPIMRELGRSVHWPVTLSEQSGSIALVRETTDAESTLVFSETKPGYRMSMLDTASGRVLLAYAPERKQRTLIDYLRCQPEGVSPFGRTCGEEFDTISGVIRTRGYDVLPMPHGRQSALAVPVVDASGHAVAALALRYFNSAMRHSDAVERFLGPLTATAARISESLGHRDGAMH
ncbi:helix-turn-helix domain-containing protein [Novosphingobium kaempferiae]|uniref:helix-turn-helix domain-containing protein n=1 Tax=Novosphingobium kaempferiae TaxID=2896849 RepID=UPI001E63519B|nr:helix-turn-helix domain-containing protein [Novosphingobium kaempferiae]